MLASELIARLEALKNEYGDYHVRFNDCEFPYNHSVNEVGLHEEPCTDADGEPDHEWVFLLEPY